MLPFQSASLGARPFYFDPPCHTCVIVTYPVPSQILVAGIRAKHLGHLLCPITGGMWFSSRGAAGAGRPRSPVSTAAQPHLRRSGGLLVDVGSVGSCFRALQHGSSLWGWGMAGKGARLCREGGPKKRLSQPRALYSRATGAFLPSSPSSVNKKYSHWHGCPMDERSTV